MGTGVKGSEQVETAASIMRREAQSLRRRAAEFEKLGIEARVKMGDELREMDRLRAEARKLEDAAHLIEPVPPVNEARDTSGVMRFSPDEMGESVSISRTGEVTRYPAPERQVPRYDKAVHSVEITGRSFAGDAVRSAVITEEEIEDGFLSNNESAAHATIWARLRKVAGLE